MRPVYLRPLIPADEAAFVASVQRSRRLHRPWVTPPATPSQFTAFAGRMVAPANHCLLVCDRQSDALAGVINITNVVMGSFRSAFLGYYAFAGFERQGRMRHGLGAAMRYAFRELGLHRLEANIQPANRASIALARACGFSREGYSPKYLKINGRWCDHERWAVVTSR